ncbi:MAG: hypothetical protein BGO29_01990 [Bacteroidales bacterium 36-12]|nr:MAG: hypothetical protein BGO29_01990 [Bacteroidales bacterium 36-12]
MEKKKNTPKLRFPEFTGEWEEKKLGHFFKDLKTGMTPYRGNLDYFKGRIPWITSGELCYNIILKTNEYITEQAIKDTNLKIYEPNTLFIAITGLEAPGTRGKCALNGIPAATNQSCMAFEAHPNINTRFLFYWYNKYGTFLYYKYAQGTKQQSFNNAIVENFDFIYSTLAEQTKIATFLTAVDEKLTQLKKKKTLLEQYKKGVMQKLFSQELRFKDDNNQDFPDWQELPGNYIFKNVSDKNHISELPILAITQEYGAIPRELIDYNITVTDKSVDSYKVVQIGDFIISLRSFQGGIEYSKYNGICSPAYIILRPIMEIEDCFFKSFFKTELYIKALNKNIEGIRDGKMISYKYFSEINLPYPSLPEQQKIATFLSAIDEKISHSSAQIEKMEAWKKGLLQQMLV